MAVQLQDVLECTICIDVAASPIHTCANGHIICGICSDKITKCGLCQAAFAVSPLAERLSRQVKINNECTYRNSKTNSSLLSRSS
jgi:hypothetical protein